MCISHAFLADVGCTWVIVGSFFVLFDSPHNDNNDDDDGDDDDDDEDEDGYSTNVAFCGIRQIPRYFSLLFNNLFHSAQFFLYYYGFIHFKLCSERIIYFISLPFLL